MEETGTPLLFVFMGLSGSGKSLVARAWAQKHEFSYFNFDMVRKQLVGVSQLSGQHASWDKEICNPQVTRRTYDALLTFAEQEIAGGKTVVLDASYGPREERVRLTQFAEAVGTKVRFVLCYCSEKETRRRLEERTGDNKGVDADWEILKKQQEDLDPLDDLESTMVVSINTGCTFDHLMDQLDFVFEKKSPVPAAK